ncbi:hypothetical protein PV327_006622 [Microctonus hyperodae]|nr:hypothetical protein PV327_006622 [Microctonus hyperodae]
MIKRAVEHFRITGDFDYLDEPKDWVDYKDDEKTVKRALNYFQLTRSESFEVLSPDELKSFEKAIEFIEKGNEQYREGNPWKDSLELYTEGVIYAPPNSNELARAYANRSAALYSGGLYDDAILDIGRALEIGYPDDLKAKLYVRRAQCFFALNKKICPDLERDVANAREWLSKMNPNGKKRVTEILDQNFSDVSSIKAPFEKIDYQRFLPKPLEGNKKLMGVSDAVELQYSEKYGRQVVATRDIKAGEAIFMHKAYASIVETEVLHKYCWHCVKRVWAGVPCHQCVSVIYCNENCRDEAWQEYHDIECLIVPVITDKMRQMGQSTWGLLTLKITVKVYKEAGSIAKLKEKIDKLKTKQDPIEKCFSGNVFDNLKYDAIYSLSRNTNCVYTSLFVVALLLSLAKNTEIFGKKYDNIKDFRNNKYMLFMGALIMRHVDLCLSNTKRDYIIDENKKKIIRGTEMVPFFCFFNHSCDPNAILYKSGNVNAMFTGQQIKKGEQIFIAYQNPYWAKFTVRERKMDLKKCFNFICECNACKHDWDLESIKSFPTRIIKGWPSSLKKKLDYLRNAPNNTNFLVSLTPTDAMTNSIKISAGIEMMNICQKYMKYPSQQMMALKTEIFHCYENSHY